MRRVRLACVLGAVLLAACPASAQRRIPVASEITGGLGDAGIRESSGVAVSRRFEGVLWTHNDSGDQPRLFAVGWSGRLIRAFTVTGARAVDWEDIALGRCPPGIGFGPTCLFIADTGDNNEERTEVTLYVIPEPDPTEGTGADSTAPAHALRMRYADGPRDAEAIASAPDGGILLFTKGRSGPIVRYTIPSDGLVGDAVILEQADTIPVRPVPLLGRWITAAAVSPSGERLVLGTHTELYFFHRGGPGWQLEGDPCWLGRPPRQWEAADWVDEESVVVTSEKATATEGVIRRVRC